MIYTKKDEQRIVEEKPETEWEVEEYRTPWRRDYARLIHSPAFRRLQGKTQLYPGIESDFFRNRLTHSLEVAQIAKSIAIRINNRCTYPSGQPLDVHPDIVEFAGLAHDIGHPPFGHQGEEQLDECMRNDGGFEGNAQTIRILARLEKKLVEHRGYRDAKDIRVGLNLTLRSLASVLKYDRIIPYTEIERRSSDPSLKPIKGYYFSEIDLVNRIKESVGISGKDLVPFKSIECRIMDIADDIAYSTYDLEDGFKAGFYTPFDVMFPELELMKRMALRIGSRLKRTITDADIQEALHILFLSMFDKPDSLPEMNDPKIYDERAYVAARASFAYISSNSMTKDGFIRGVLTSELVGKFIRGVEFEFNSDYPAMSDVRLNEETRFLLEVLKTFTFEMQICSSRLKIVEYRGKEIVRKIFETLTTSDHYQLMPPDFRELYETAPPDQKKRVVCDFIAGMTDKYAIEFYGRLTSENPETIFKPY